MNPNGQPKQEWRLVALEYPCETCDAAPGEPCFTSGQRLASMPHATRTRLASANGWKRPQ